MRDGDLYRTFYVPQSPTQVDQIDFELEPYQTQIFNRANQTTDLGRLHLELEAIGNGLVWHHDRFQVIPGLGAQQWQGLMTLCKL